MSPFFGTSGIAFPPILQSAQEFHEGQVATLRSMEHYCTWTPKFHQWLHLSRTHEPNGERLQTTDCHSNTGDATNSISPTVPFFIPPGVGRTRPTTPAGWTRAITSALCASLPRATGASLRRGCLARGRLSSRGAGTSVFECSAPLLRRFLLTFRANATSPGQCQKRP